MHVHIVPVRARCQNVYVRVPRCVGRIVYGHGRASACVVVRIRARSGIRVTYTGIAISSLSLRLAFNAPASASPFALCQMHMCIFYARDAGYICGEVCGEVSVKVFVLCVRAVCVYEFL